MSADLQEMSPKADDEMSLQETPKTKSRAGLDYMTVGVSTNHITYINNVLKK